MRGLWARVQAEVRHERLPSARRAGLRCESQMLVGVGRGRSPASWCAALVGLSGCQDVWIVMARQSSQPSVGVSMAPYAVFFGGGDLRPRSQHLMPVHLHVTGQPGQMHES